MELDSTKLRQFSAAELAEVLANNPRSSELWRLAKQECQRRCQRWGIVAASAASAMAACLFLLVVTR